MMKYFAGAISALFFGWLVVQAVQPAPTNWQGIIDQASAEVYGAGACSGTLIGDNDILTASHCILKGKEADLLKVDLQGKEYLARVVKIDREKDLALLVIPGVTFKNAVKLAEDPAKLLENIYVVGNPRNMFPDTITQGVVSFVDRVLPDLKGKWLQLDVTAAPGNSGGMIANEHGELVGVLVMAATTPYEFAGHYIFAVTLENVKEFLKNENF